MSQLLQRGQTGTAWRGQVCLQSCTCWHGFSCQVSSCLRRSLVCLCFMAVGLCCCTCNVCACWLLTTACYDFVNQQLPLVCSGTSRFLRGLWVSAPPTVSPIFAAPPRQVGVQPHASFHTDRSPLCHKLGRCAAVAACLTLDLPQHICRAVHVEF